jgi:hypothetical protein
MLLLLFLQMMENNIYSLSLSVVTNTSQDVVCAVFPIYVSTTATAATRYLPLILAGFCSELKDGRCNLNYGFVHMQIGERVCKHFLRLEIGG